SWRTTAQKVSMVVGRAGKVLEFFYVNHAKATLGCTPGVTRCRINQFVKTVMSKVEMPMTSGELKEAITIGEMDIRISDYQISSTDIGRRHSEAYQLMFAGCNSAFFNTTGGG